MAYKRVEISEQDIQRQLEICRRIKEKNDRLYSPPLAMVDTYGCQQNEADSETIRGYLREMGYSFTQDEDEADVIVINTCAVREHAEMRILSNVGALNRTKKKNPGQIIALCGCMVQQEHMVEKIKRSYRVVDLVFGTHDLWRFPELLEQVMSDRKRIFAVRDMDGVIAEGVPHARDSRIKAWLSVMYGCNNFCTYCVVPYVRGRERSRLPEDILAEARALVENGCKDITLLGQNVNSYGKDLGLGIDFADLLRMISEIPGEFLIRFMTSHPKDATEKLFATMAECEKCARHIHLPVQSGSARILKAMNRVYTPEQYIALVDRARELMPDLVITTDIIVGFPGETEEDFEDTLRLVERVRFDAAFTFIYSKRSGTPPPKWRTRHKRGEAEADRLLALQNAISAKSTPPMGRVERVLVDDLSEESAATSGAEPTAAGLLT